MINSYSKLQIKSGKNWEYRNWEKIEGSFVKVLTLKSELR